MLNLVIKNEKLEMNVILIYGKFHGEPNLTRL